MMDNKRNLISGLFGVLTIVGYLIFYFKGKTFEDLTSFDPLDFLAGLGFAMILYLFLCLMLRSQNIVIGIIGFVVLVFIMCAIEDKYQITKIQENIGFAIVGVIGTIVCIVKLTTGIKDAIIDYKYEKYKRLYEQAKERE